MISLKIFDYHHPFGISLSLFDLLIVSSIFFAIMGTLILYIKKISTGEKSILNDFSERPLYQSRDILLQEKSLNDSLAYIPVKQTTSVFAKVMIAILALTILCTPLYELLGVEYFI